MDMSSLTKFVGQHGIFLFRFVFVLTRFYY